MNDRELIAELIEKRPGGDMKIAILVESKGRAYTIDSVGIMPPVQVKQIYGEEGHRFILYLNEESAI